MATKGKSVVHRVKDPRRTRHVTLDLVKQRLGEEAYTFTQFMPRFLKRHDQDVHLVTIEHKGQQYRFEMGLRPTIYMHMRVVEQDAAGSPAKAEALPRTKKTAPRTKPAA